ncbi:MAG TPA: hypothetical protein VGW58_14130, partial [Pyrinomonadaceae bacterium]|nr:hypothetical protein [Pyrinomonadaceae bacterium]
MLRSKSFLTYFLICAIPLLLLAALNYWNGMRSARSTLESILEEDVHAYTAGVDHWLENEGNQVLKLAVTPEIQRAGNDPSVRKTVHATLKSAWDFGVFKSLALFDRNRQPLWFSTSTQQWEIWDAGVDSAVRSQLPRPDDRVWTAPGNVLFERPVEDASSKGGVELAVPIHNETGLGNEGAIVAILDLDRLL